MRLNVERIEQPGGLRIDIGIDKAVRVTVSNQKTLQPQYVSAMTRSNQHDAANALLDNVHAAQNERTHDDLADVWLSADQPAKVIAGDADQATFNHRDARHQNHALIEVVKLASELMARMRGDYSRLTFIVEIDDLDATLQHQKKISAALTALKQSCTGCYLLSLAIRRDALSHLVGQAGKSLCAACIRVRI